MASGKRIQLYSLDTPNGQKIAAFLEEAGVEYEAHVVDIRKGDQLKPEFLKISPNNKIPALVDLDGPDGKPLSIFESGAILIYLAEKTGKFLPKDVAGRAEVFQWLFWQMSGLGPNAGQLGHFLKFAPEKVPYAEKRFADEVDRLLGVLEKQLEGHDWVVGNELSIADFAIIPWLNSMSTRLPYDFSVKHPNIKAYVERFVSRPAVQRGLVATPFPQ